MQKKKTMDGELDVARAKILREAEDDINWNCGGNWTYLDWLPRGAAGLDLMLGQMSSQIDRELLVLPLPVLQSMADVFVELHKHAFTVWEHRDELSLLSRPAIPGRPS
jgi:hypothetical protein